MIGGQPTVVLTAPQPSAAPGFVEAAVLPSRGMMLSQARLALPDGRIVEALAAPDPEAAEDDFAGNASFGFGGAVLAPFANRIRGRSLADARAIATTVAGETVRLPRNWGGRAPGAEQYAMHGLILDAAFAADQEASDRAHGRLEAGDFDGQWPGGLRLDIDWSLRGGALVLCVTATSTGERDAPVGLGWHPYFRLPSGDRAQARLWLAAAGRVLVDNYDTVLPTGEVAPTAGSDWDFAQPGGRALGRRYIDDCFTDLAPRADQVLAELRDPAAGLGLRLSSGSPHIRAIQVYAPPDKPFVVIEPQFNLANPYGAEWQGRDTGMVSVPPGASVVYEVTVEPFALG